MKKAKARIESIHKSPVKRTIALFLLFLLVVGFLTPIVVRADDEEAKQGKYYSWIRNRSKETTAPADKDGAGTHSSKFDDDNPGTIEKLLASVVASIGTGINKALKGREQVDADGNIIPSAIDASTTGIIMGKITHGNSYFVFDLTDDNVYGRIGASIYVILRAFCFAILFILTLIGIIKSMYVSEGRGLARLKDSLMTTVIVMILLFMMPQIVDWLCEVRDKVCVIMYEGMAGLLTGDTAQGTSKLTEMISLEEQYFARYDETPTVLNAFVYTMVCCIPLVFIISYLKIAVQQTILFGLFPVFAVLSPNDKKSLTEWSTVVFSNIFIPAIDVALMLLPALVLEVFLAVAGSGAGLLKALVTIVMVMGIVPVRNQILTMLGNKFGIATGMGLIGAGIMAAKAVQGAAAMASNSFKGSSKSEEKESTSDEEGRESDESLAAAVAEHKAEISEVPPNPTADANAAAGKEADADLEQASQTAVQEASRAESTEQTNVEGDVHNESSSIEAVSLNSVPTSAKEDEAILQQAAQGSSAARGEVHQEVAPENGTSSTPQQVVTQAAATPENDVIAENVVTANNLALSGAGGAALAAAVEERAAGVNRVGDDHVGKSFNMERAANLQSIDNLKDASRKIDVENAGHHKDISRAQLKLNTPGISDAERQEAETNIAMAKASISENNAQKQVIKGEISRRQEIEKGMAETSAYHGRSDKVFDSANDFRRQLQHETKVRNISNYKNFNIEGSAFSQRERAEFERTKEVHEARDNIRRVALRSAAVTAGLATAGVASLSVAAGGEQAMSAVAAQGISMATDPNLLAAPGAIARTIDRATGNHLSTYGRSAVRAAGQAVHGAKDHTFEHMGRSPIGRQMIKTGEGAKDRAEHVKERYVRPGLQKIKDLDEKIMKYGEKKK